jgi:ABC-type nickel/cobalt efflux system permease component RcnA
VAPETETTKASESTLTILAMLGGLGIVAMVVAAGIGVVLPEIDSGLVSLIVLAGAGFLVTSIGGWVIATRPYENFDDITVAQYHGHHHEEHHEEEAAQH